MIWTAYSRLQRRVIAFLVGDQGVESAISLYRLVKRLVPRIAAICTDANKCYAIAFARYRVPEPHIVTKAQTHLVESSNSSIRDNLARFNRRSKRHSKSWDMLNITLDLFFNKHRLQQPSHAT